MEKPKFTPEQEDWICNEIGSWYFEWKDKITDGGQHRLGYAKELLKERLCTSFEPTVEQQIAKAFMEGCMFKKQPTEGE